MRALIRILAFSVHACSYFRLFSLRLFLLASLSFLVNGFFLEPFPIPIQSPMKIDTIKNKALCAHVWERSTRKISQTAHCFHFCTNLEDRRISNLSLLYLSRCLKPLFTLSSCPFYLSEVLCVFLSPSCFFLPSLSFTQLLYLFSTLSVVALCFS